MDIPRAFGNFYKSCQHYCYKIEQSAVPQAAMSTEWKVKTLFSDTDFFQKICQVAFASLQLFIIRYPAIAGSLARFSFVLTTANMHDFYRFVQHPLPWFCPITAKSINEFAVLNDLTDLLCKKTKRQKIIVNDEIIDEDDILESESETEVERQNKLKGANENKIENTENIEKNDEILREALFGIAKECLDAQLKQMNTHGDAYRDLDTFVELLKKRLNDPVLQERLKGAVSGNLCFLNLDLSELNRKNYDLSKWIRHVPLAEKIMHINWSIVDIGCVGLYLQGWNLIDTAKWANCIGQYPGFQWVVNHHLDHWVVGLVCTAFSWKLFEAVRQLCDEALTKQQRDVACRNVITSLAELVLFGAIFANQMGKTHFNNVHLQCFAIAAKSLALLSIATMLSHKFFQKPQAASMT